MVTHKDKDQKLYKSGDIYHFKCSHIYWSDEYIWESDRPLGESIKEHLKAPSPIHQHSSSTGHPFSPECFNIIHRETQGSSRNIKEAMFIQVKWHFLKKKSWEVSIATCLGQHSTRHTNATSQVIQPHPHSPTWTTPNPTSQHPLSPTKGVTCTFLGKYSNWRCLNTPQSYLTPLTSSLFSSPHFLIQQCHLGKLAKLLFSLTFLSGLMKWC